MLLPPTFHPGIQLQVGWRCVCSNGKQAYYTQKMCTLSSVAQRKLTNSAPLHVHVCVCVCVQVLL